MKKSQLRILIKEIISLMKENIIVPGYVYHVTDIKLLPVIKKQGMQPEHQHAKLFFSTDEKTSQQWKTEKRNITLRIKTINYKFKDDWQWKNVVTTGDTIRPDDIEVETENGWLELLQWNI
jgi:RNA:NAD 2'-phosphotransferase (TPT1/KptA family)